MHICICSIQYIYSIHAYAFIYVCVCICIFYWLKISLKLAVVNMQLHHRDTGLCSCKCTCKTTSRIKDNLCHLHPALALDPLYAYVKALKRLILRRSFSLDEENESVPHLFTSADLLQTASCPCSLQWEHSSPLICPAHKTNLWQCHQPEEGASPPALTRHPLRHKSWDGETDSSCVTPRPPDLPQCHLLRWTQRAPLILWDKNRQASSRQKRKE